MLGWSVIAQKDEFQVGDEVVYIEIDSILPERKEFEFLRDRKFRIKTMKMGGVLSQGIVFPKCILPGDASDYTVGDDVTKELQITKYEPEIELPEMELPAASKQSASIPKWLKLMLEHTFTRRLGERIMKARKRKQLKAEEWPDFILKTDEPRVQNMPWVLEEKSPFIVTEKVDGQSGTFFVRKRKGLLGYLGLYEYGVCSRNKRLPVKDHSSYWAVSDKYDMRSVLMDIVRDHRPGAEWCVVQGEVIGPKIQGNKYRVQNYEMYAFNLLFPYQKGTGIIKTESVRARAILGSYGVPFVPILDTHYILPDTVDELLEAASGESELAPTLREGFVLRNYVKNISFKAVSNEFLLKWKE